MPARRQRREQPDRIQAVLYARVSSSDQEKEGFSIPAQQRLLRQYALDHGISIAEEFVDVETAKATGRTGFTKMLAYLRKYEHRVRAILVEKTDRLYRNIKDWATLDEFGVSIHFVKENVIIGPESCSSDQFVHGIKVLMARNYSLNLGEETVKGMTEKARAGIYPSCAPAGYRNVDGPHGKRIIVPDPKDAPVITELFATFATGNYSLRDLSAYCKQHRLLLRGRVLYVSLLHQVLRKRIYMGDFDWNGTMYRGIHEPLTTPEIWYRVQKILSGRKDSQVKSVRKDFPFSGFVKCGHCGCAMVGELKKGRYVYYHCTGFRGKCDEPYTRQEVLTDQFAHVLSDLVIPQDTLEWLAAAVNESDYAEVKARELGIRSRTMELQRLSRQQSVLYDDRLQGRISAEMYDQKAAEFEHRKVELGQKIEELKSAPLPPLLDAVDVLRLTSQACDFFRNQSGLEQRKLLTMLVKEANWKGGELQMTLQEPFEQLRLSNHKKLNGMNGIEGKEGGFEEWLLR